MPEKPTITIIADKLLTLIQACKPLAGKDTERPHLMLLHFSADKTDLECYATDGHTLGKVSADVSSCSEPTSFSIATEHLPVLEKLLSRLDQKERSETAVELQVGRSLVQLLLQSSKIVIPKSAEQIEIPYDKVIPDAYVPGAEAVASWAFNPELLARVLRCASRPGHAVEITAPKTRLSAMRFDIVQNIAGYKGTFVVMPMNVDDPQAEAAPAGEPDEKQTEIESEG